MMTFRHQLRQANAMIIASLSILNGIITIVCFHYGLLGLALGHLIAIIFSGLLICRWARKITYTLLICLAFSLCLISYLTNRSISQKRETWIDSLDLLQRPLYKIETPKDDQSSDHYEFLSVIPTLSTPPTPSLIEMTHSQLTQTTTSEQRTSAHIPHDDDGVKSLRRHRKSEILDLGRLPQKTWSKGLIARIITSYKYIKPDVTPPEALWDRENGNAQLTGYFEYVRAASQGYPDILMIPKSQNPEQDLIILAKHLPDQQRRQRISVIAELLSESPWIQRNGSEDSLPSKGTELLEDVWSACTFLAALLGVSSEEFNNLVAMTRRTHLFSLMNETELRMIMELAQEVAEIAASQPVKRNSTYEFIISGRPVAEAPNNLAKMLSFLENSFAPNSTKATTSAARNLQEASARAAMLDVDEVIDRIYVPLAERLDKHIYRARATMTLSSILMILWVILSLRSLYPSCVREIVKRCMA